MEEAFGWMDAFPEERDENVAMSSGINHAAGPKRPGAPLDRRWQETKRPRGPARFPGSAATSTSFGMEVGDQSFVVPGIRKLTEEHDIPREDGLMWTPNERINVVPNLPFNPTWQEEVEARNKILDANVDMRFIRSIAGNMVKDPWELFEETGLREVTLKTMYVQLSQRLELDRTRVGTEEKLQQVRQLERIMASNAEKIADIREQTKTKVWVDIGDVFMSADKFYYAVRLMEEYTLLLQTSGMLSSETAVSHAYSENKMVHEKLKAFLAERLNTEPHPERDADEPQLNYRDVVWRNYTMYAWSLFFRDQLDNDQLEQSFPHGSGEQLRTLVQFAMYVAQFGKFPVFRPGEKTIAKDWWKNTEKLLDETVGMESSNAVAMEDKESAIRLETWFRQGWYPLLEQTVPSLTFGPVLGQATLAYPWENLAETKTVNLKNLHALFEHEYSSQDFVGMLVRLSGFGCDFVSPEARDYCTTFVSKLDAARNTTGVPDIGLPPLAIGKLWQLVFAIDVVSRAVVLMAHLIWLLFKKNKSWKIVKLLLAAGKHAKPDATDGWFDKSVARFVGHLSHDDKRTETPTPLPLLRRGATVHVLRRCINFSLACMSEYFGNVYNDLHAAEVVDFGVAAISVLEDAVGPMHGLRLLNTATRGRNPLESVTDLEFGRFALDKMGSQEDVEYFHTYPIGVVQRLRGEYNAYGKRKAQALSLQNGRFQTELENAQNIVARLAGEKRVPELPAPGANHVPSKEWMLSPAMSGRIVLKDIVPAAISDAYDKVQMFVRDLAHMSLDDIEHGGASLANSFAALVAALIAEKQLMFPHQYTQTIQHVTVKAGVNESLQKLKRYKTNGGRDAPALGQRRTAWGTRPLGLWDG